MNGRLIVIAGLPAAGKSTMAEAFSKNIDNSIWISNDNERIRLGISVRSGKTVKVYESITKKSLKYLNQEKDVILDATFYRSRYRQILMDQIMMIKPPTLIIELSTPEAECRARITERKQHISGLGINDIKKFNDVARHYSSWEFNDIYNWMTRMSINAQNDIWNIGNEEKELLTSEWQDIYKILEGGIR